MSLQVGFAKVDITPPLGTPLRGYYYERLASDVHDPLHVRVLVLAGDGSEPVALIGCELCSLSRALVAEARKQVSLTSGIRPERVMLWATHIHTGPGLTGEYARRLPARIAQGVLHAMKELRPARLSFSSARVPGLCFNRRYRMRDGSVCTNPGKRNPAVVGSAGPVEETLSALCVTGARGEGIAVLAHYGLHLDTIGGTVVSADWPHFLESEFQRQIGAEVPVLFAMGPAGDVNHWDLSDPSPQRGFEEASRIGTTLGASLARIWKPAEPVPSSELQADIHGCPIDLPYVAIEAGDVEKANKILKVPPPPDVDFTMERVWAQRVIDIDAKGSKKQTTEVQAARLGNLLLLSMPAEIFVEVGWSIQQATGWRPTLVVSLANDAVGYIPTRKACAEGGYEAMSTRFAPGTDEILADAARTLAREMQRRTAR
jgi:hypothetical protein